MAYNLPLQLVIQPPTQGQLNAIKQSVESALSGINVGSVDAKNFAKTNVAIQQTGKQFEKTGQKAEKFWDSVEGRTRSAIAYTAISTALMKVTGAVSQATREAIKYEAELLKISQVTGDSVQLTKDYSKSLVDISKKYNVTLSKVAQLTRTLNQTGLSFKEAAKGAEVLARTSLLATFDSLTSTTEGLIAVMQTFEFTVTRAGKVLESINSVSKAFAVESTDIVEAIRRTGGAFSTAGGSIEELIALFTAVRSTSRESAETIATGFRTIFGRLQRPKTIEYFKQLGIQLETAEGQFIGPYQAIEQISKGLERLGIAAGSTRFAEVVEQIGGIRQISRVVPLLEQAAKSQRALDIANSGTVDSIKDVEKAQQGLGYQLGALQKEFGALISDIVNSPSFKFLAEVFINTSKAVLRLVGALKPLLPILASVAAFKIGRGLSKLLSGGFSLKGAKESLGFASGGMVPGSGNGDTVPAMLTPGEFVIRKSAVQAFGADRLASINKYAKGGPVSLDTLQKRQGKTTITESLNDVREPIDNISADLNRKKIKFGDESYGIDWDKFVYDVDAIYKRQKVKGQPFSAQGKAFEAVIQKIAGGELAPEPDYPVDIVNNGNPIEVKFTKELTDEKDLVSKLYRYKYKTSQLNNLGFTKGYDKDVDIGDLTVYEMGEGEKAEFNKWYGKKVQGGLSPKEKEFGQILLSEDGKNIEAKYAPNEKRTGFVRTKFWKDNLYTIGLSKATKGYGPKLYDVAMEAITAKGGMLTSDRATVSGDARKVWDFYFNNRSDVKKTPLPRDQWTGNYALVDEKLRGPKETWPPTTDPAWALQTGYSKSPSLINDPNIVKRVKGQQSSAAMALNYFSRFANGGSVNTGTDTVPALLTPGEFVINKKSAQSFGYDKLHEINKYADGGFVQHFKNGGMSKAERTLSKSERKRLLEQSKAEKSADGLTRAGRREAGQLARGKDEVDFIAVQEKWTKYIDEETKNAKEVYQAKVKQVQEEGGSIKEMSALIKEYNSVVQTIKAEAKGYQRKEEESISAKNIVEAQAEVKQKESDAATAETPAVKEVEKATKSLAQKIKDGGGAVYDSLSSLGVSYAEAALQAQSIVSGLKNFAGLDVNQEALTQAQVKGGVLSGAGEAVGKFADPKVIEGFGSQLNKVGKMLPKSIGGPVRKFGGMLLKNGASIAKGFSMAAKGLNVLSFVELGGGLLDALFSTDYGKQRDNLIALGDAAGAATAAAQAYSQEQYRAIPIIGGFLSAMGAGSGATEKDLDATGKLVVANARLEANLNGIDREVTKAKNAFKDAQALGDIQGQRDAISGQLDAIDTLKANAEDVASKTSALQTSGAATYGSGSSIAKGAIGGAVGGAAIGAMVGSVFPVIGTAIGAGVGALIGGVAGAAAGWMSSSKLAKEQIIQGYELQGEAAKKAAEEQAALITMFTGQLESEAIRMVRSGGTYQDALAKITEQIGQDNVKRLLGGKELTGDAETDIKTASESVKAADARILQLQQEASLLKDSEKTKKAELEAQIATAEGEREKALALKNGLVQTQSAIIKEKQLEERRMIEAKAMEYQIALLEEMESAYDGFNATMAEAKNIAEEAANIGTNNLTTRQAAAMSGVRDSRIYEMSADRIVDTPEVASQMATRVGLNTMRGQEILKGQERVQTLSRIKGEVVDTGSLKDIYANVQDGETADAKQIQDAIYEKLGLTEGADPVLDEEIRKYAEKIAKDGISAAGEAAQQAKEGATAQSKQIIEEQQKIDKELFDAQKQLRDMQIELAQKQMANAQQAYDNEKDYFDKRSALANKVEDVLSPIKEGPGKAAAMAARGAARTGAARDALGARRRKQFGEIGLGGQSLGQAVNTVSSGFEAAGEASEELKGQMDALMSTIQDEIQIEQDYLDTLIEVAKAQQEYTQALNDAQGELVRNLVTGTEEEVGNQLTALNAAAVAASQGSFAGIPEELKKDVFALFDQFGDIEIPGLGMTGRDAQREITKNELMRNFGYDEQTASKLASKAVKDKVPVDERMAEQIKNQEQKIAALLNYEKQLKDAQLAQERENTQLFAQKVEEFAAAVNKMTQQAGQEVKSPEELQNDPMVQAQNQQAQAQADMQAKQADQTTAANDAVAKQEATLKEKEDALAKAQADLQAKTDEYNKEDEKHRRATRHGNLDTYEAKAYARRKQALKPGLREAAEAELKARKEVTRAKTNLGTAKYNRDQLDAKQEIERQNQQNAINEENRRRQAGGGKSFTEITNEGPIYESSTGPADPNDPFGPDSQSAGTQREFAQNQLMSRYGFDEQTASNLASKAYPTTSVNASSFNSLAIKDKAGTISTDEKNKYEAMKQVNSPSNVASMSEMPGLAIKDKIGTITTDEKNKYEAMKQVSGNAGGPPVAMPESVAQQPGNKQPIQVQTQGEQQITVNLPDIQGLVNQQITALVYETVGSKFTQIANDVRSAQNFDDVANALSNGVSETSTRNV